MNWIIEPHERVSSTQDVLKKSERQDEGLVIHALSQEAGRGRHGRVWEMLPGNLCFSLLLKPDCDVALIGQLSLLAGLAVYRAAADALGAEDAGALMLKWPNDVLLGGHKCAGILLETDMSAQGCIERVYLGVGVNLMAAPSEMGAALQGYCDQRLDLGSFRDTVLEHLGGLYQSWQQDGFDLILQAWLEAAHAQGAPLSVKVGEEIERGFFHEVNAMGHLVLSQRGHVFKTITAGDVYL